jgi:hypothetical protein
MLTTLFQVDSFKQEVILGAKMKNPLPRHPYSRDLPPPRGCRSIADSLAVTRKAFGTAKHEPFGSPVDDENEAQLFQKPWDSPVSSRILCDSLGTVPVFEIFEADPGHAGPRDRRVSPSFSPVCMQRMSTWTCFQRERFRSGPLHNHRRLPRGSDPYCLGLFCPPLAGVATRLRVAGGGCVYFLDHVFDV